MRNDAATDELGEGRALNAGLSGGLHRGNLGLYRAVRGVDARKFLILMPILALCIAASARAAVKDEMVEITGSRIKQKVRHVGFTTDGVAPVLVLDRVHIEEWLGAFRVADVLRRIPFAQVRDAKASFARNWFDSSAERGRVSARFAEEDRDQVSLPAV